MSSQDRRQARPSLVPAVIAVLVGVAAAACAGSEPARDPAPRPAADRICPPPLIAPNGVRTAAAVRVDNRGGRAWVVFLDRCRGHTRLGTVDPGRTRLFSLPPALIAYDDGVRFHLFGTEGSPPPRRSFAVPVDTSRVLKLVVPAADAERPRM